MQVYGKVVLVKTQMVLGKKYEHQEKLSEDHLQYVAPKHNRLLQRFLVDTTNTAVSDI